MSKNNKIAVGIVVAVILIVIAGVFGLHYMVNNAGAMKIEAEELPCDLKWGMTKEKARATLENAGYIEQETTAKLNFFLYRVPVYQGHPDAGAIVMCVFDDQDKLDWIMCNFYKTSEGGFMESEEKVDELQAAFKKAYEKECQEFFVTPDYPVSDECCVMDKSLVSFVRNGKGFSVIFEDREDEIIQEHIESLRHEYQ